MGGIKFGPVGWRLAVRQILDLVRKVGPWAASVLGAILVRQLNVFLDIGALRDGLETWTWCRVILNRTTSQSPVVCLAKTKRQFVQLANVPQWKLVVTSMIGLQRPCPVPAPSATRSGGRSSPYLTNR